MYISPVEVVILLVLGLVAGIVNTLAGGGSNLTVPALMVFGMPPEIANATNRIGVFLQGIAGTSGFRKHGKLPMRDFKRMIPPSLHRRCIRRRICCLRTGKTIKVSAAGSNASCCRNHPDSA